MSANQSLLIKIYITENFPEVAEQIQRIPGIRIRCVFNDVKVITAEATPTAIERIRSIKGVTTIKAMTKSHAVSS